MPPRPIRASMRYPATTRPRNGSADVSAIIRQYGSPGARGYARARGRRGASGGRRAGGRAARGRQPVGPSRARPRAGRDPGGACGARRGARARARRAGPGGARSARAPHGPARRPARGAGGVPGPGPAEPVRAVLDPLGLDTGPPVVGLEELGGEGRLGNGGLAHLRLLLEHRAMRARLAELEAIVASQALAAFRDTETVRLDALDRLAQAAEYRDDNTPEHTQRVGALAARLGRALGLADRA